MDIGLGLTAQAEINVGEYSFKDNKPFELLETSYALPTQCLSFDAGAKSYAAATATAAAAGSATAGGKGRSGAVGGGDRNPFVGWRGMLVGAGLVGVGSVCFVVL